MPLKRQNNQGHVNVDYHESEYNDKSDKVNRQIWITVANRPIILFGSINCSMHGARKLKTRIEIGKEILKRFLQNHHTCQSHLHNDKYGMVMIAAAIVTNYLFRLKPGSHQ